MKKMNLLVFLCVLFCGTISFAQHIERNELIVGLEMKFHSLTLNEERILNVYLPEGYSENDSMDYPVIYLLDGSMDEDFIHISGIVQFQSYSWISTIPPSIVVGISNIDRKRDFTFPTTIEKDKADFPTTGSSANFITFLEQEVKPMIQSNFRTTNTATLIGQSLGGLLATEILIKKPELFTHYLIVSPSLWWNAESLLDETIKISPETKVHIAVGKEGKVMVSDAKELFKQIKKSEGAISENITFEYFKENDHADILHPAAYSGLKFLYSEKKID